MLHDLKILANSCLLFGCYGPAEAYCTAYTLHPRPARSKPKAFKAPTPPGAQRHMSSLVPSIYQPVRQIWGDVCLAGKLYILYSNNT